MTWFALDDQGAFHPKVLAAKNEAYGAWCRAGQWASQHLTDGFVTRDVALTIARLSVWKKLIAVRLLEEVEGGFQIHDFTDWNPSRDQVLAERERRSAVRAEAGRKGGKRSGEARRAGSKREANAKQLASKNEANDEANAKQNEAPIPIPSASSKQIPPGGADEAAPAVLFALEPTRPRRKPKPSTPVDALAADAWGAWRNVYPTVRGYPQYTGNKARDGAAMRAIASDALELTDRLGRPSTDAMQLVDYWFREYLADDGPPPRCFLKTNCHGLVWLVDEKRRYGNPWEGKASGTAPARRMTTAEYEAEWDRRLG